MRLHQYSQRDPGFSFTNIIYKLPRLHNPNEYKNKYSYQATLFRSVQRLIYATTKTTLKA